MSPRKQKMKPGPRNVRDLTFAKVDVKLGHFSTTLLVTKGKKTLNHYIQRLKSSLVTLKRLNTSINFLPPLTRAAR